MIFKRKIFIVFLALVLCGCSGMEKSEQEKIKKMHALSEPILRYAGEQFHAINFPEKKVRERYSWENTLAHQFPKITKEAFRCKGSGNPKPKILRENVAIFDCQGADKHSLPLNDDKEMIYPALLEILNYLQDHLRKKVVVTSGHRCYAHQTYLLGTSSGALTKYLIGAQVDFLIDGIQASSEKIIACLSAYYQELFPDQKEYQLEKSVAGVWQNKEISLKLFAKHEGRNEDNAHEYPYLSIELKHDRLLDKKIQVNMQQAMNGYYRF
jgi:hypothetical protein